MSWEDAVGIIVVSRGAQRTSRGSGFLVGERRVLTALHVVADKASAEPLGDRIQVRFRAGGAEITRTAKLVDGRCDTALDWALLELDEAVDVRPIPLSPLRDDDIEWRSWGFPDLNVLDGLTVYGKFLRRDATFNKTSAIELDAPQIPGVPISGLSGGPVVVDGSAVGIVRGTHLDGDRRVIGTWAFACPIGPVLDRCVDLLPVDVCRGLPPPRAAATLPATPYVYLSAFGEEHASLFFGRCRDIRRLYDAVVDPEGPRVIALFGPTGVGKSSLLRAGLIPRLVGACDVKILRRDVKDGLLAAVRRELGGDDITAAWRVAEAASGRPLLVIVDQLEDAYLAASPARDDDEVATLLAELKTLPAPRGKLLLAFRKEWLAELERSQAKADVATARVFMEPVDRAAIVEIVHGIDSTPQLRKTYHVTVEPGLGAAIADKLLEDEASSITPALQILLTNMWRKARMKSADMPQFTRALLGEVQKDDYLRAFLEQQLSAIRTRDPHAVDSGLVLDLLEQHTDPRGVARQRDSAELAAIYAPRRIDSLVTLLKEHHLLTDPRVPDRDQADDTRLVHDTLAPYVRDAFRVSTARGQRARRLLELRVGDEAQTVLDTTDYDTVRQGLGGMRGLTPAEETLLARSKRAHDVRLVRGLGIGVGVVLAAVATGLLVAQAVKDERRQAELSRQSLAAAALYDRSSEIVPVGAETDDARVAFLLAAMALENVPASDDRIVSYERWLLSVARKLPVNVAKIDRPLVGNFSPDLATIIEIPSKAGDYVLAFDTATGRELWAKAVTKARFERFTSDGRVVIRDDASGDPASAIVMALDLRTGDRVEPIAPDVQDGIDPRISELRTRFLVANGATVGHAPARDLFWAITRQETSSELYVWRAGDGVAIVNATVGPGPLAVAADGTRIAHRTSEGWIRTWDLERAANRVVGKRLPIAPDHQTLMGLFLPDGEGVVATVVGGYADQRIAFFRGEQVWSLPVERNPAHLALSRDGRHVAVVLCDYGPRVCEILYGPIGTPPRRVAEVPYLIDALAIDRDGHIVTIDREDLATWAWSRLEPATGRRERCAGNGFRAPVADLDGAARHVLALDANQTELFIWTVANCGQPDRAYPFAPDAATVLMILEFNQAWDLVLPPDGPLPDQATWRQAMGKELAPHLSTATRLHEGLLSRDGRWTLAYQPPATILYDRVLTAAATHDLANGQPTIARWFSEDGARARFLLPTGFVSDVDLGSTDVAVVAARRELLLSAFEPLTGLRKALNPTAHPEDEATKLRAGFLERLRAMKEAGDGLAQRLLDTWGTAP